MEEEELEKIRRNQIEYEVDIQKRNKKIGDRREMINHLLLYIAELEEELDNLR